jgi:hypothetical protein
MIGNIATRWIGDIRYDWRLEIRSDGRRSIQDTTIQCEYFSFSLYKMAHEDVSLIYHYMFSIYIQINV